MRNPLISWQQHEADDAQWSAAALDSFGPIDVRQARLTGGMGIQAAGRPAGTVAAAGPTTIRDVEGKRLVAECLADDAVARARFQEQFGPLIYRFATYGGGRDVEPGDFYVYLFEDDRLYRRLRSYEGWASLGPFLRGYALPDLFKQFLAMNRREALDTVGLDVDCVRAPGGSLASDDDQELRAERGGGPQSPSAELFDQLDPEKRTLVKLLYIEDFELAPSEVRLLAERSGRSLREVIRVVEQARESVRSREAMRQRRLEDAESATQWILRYERRLAGVAEDLENLPPRSTQAERLREQQAELERKRAWRQQQRTRALAKSRQATVTLRYREIAEILNQAVGTVSAQVTRLRQELLALAAQRASGRKVATDEHR